ncbi:hypothetical protein HP467_11040 [Curtobacterium albidum]|uniref:Uncharacterized protein n=1 Tax=Curtobacterium citreum TaxID=2036 RepID=A0A850DUK9_9MICO|nr:hypothetical protein [Curtobacterium albidum]NUU28641.1 hypothetical protein [Curtobacterium albidum]
MDGNRRNGRRTTSAIVSTAGLVVAGLTGAGVWIGHEVTTTTGTSATDSSTTSTTTSGSSTTDSGTTSSSGTGTGTSDHGVSQGTTGGSGASDATTTGS